MTSVDFRDFAGHGEYGSLPAEARFLAALAIEDGRRNTSLKIDRWGFSAHGLAVPFLAVATADSFVHHWAPFRFFELSERANIEHYRAVRNKPVQVMYSELVDRLWDRTFEPAWVIDNLALLYEIRNDLAHATKRVSASTRTGLEARGLWPTSEEGAFLYITALQWSKLAPWFYDVAADAARALLLLDPRPGEQEMGANAALTVPPFDRSLQVPPPEVPNRIAAPVAAHR